MVALAVDYKKYNGVCGVYEIFCIVNDKIYIGSSKNLGKRLKDHINSLNRGDHDNIHLQNTFNKYGSSVFQFNIVEIVISDEVTLRKIEEGWIKSKDATNRGIGFNMTDVCSPNFFEGKKHTEETKKKISEAKKGKNTGENNPFFGKKHPEELIQKLAQKKLGTKFTDEQKEILKLSKAHIDMSEVGHKSWRTRRKNGNASQTKESCAKRWKNRRAKHGTDNGLGKVIIAFNEQGQEAMRFISSREAYRNGYTTAERSARTGGIGKGYYWKYEQDIK